MNDGNPNIQCFACHGWGHLAHVCANRNRGSNQNSQGPLINLQPNFMPNSSNSGVYGQGPNANYPAGMCRYCKQMGHLVSECQVRVSRQGPFVMRQGSASSVPV